MILHGDKRCQNSKNGDSRFVVWVAGNARDAALRELEEFHFLGFTKDEQGPTLPRGARSLATPMSRHSHREEDLLSSWQNERKKLLSELAEVHNEIETLEEKESEARKGKIQLQRTLEAELHALKKEKRCWELERRQMVILVSFVFVLVLLMILFRSKKTEAMAVLREELEALKSAGAAPKEKKEDAAPSKCVCVGCRQNKPLSDYSTSQKRKRAAERRCKSCAELENAKH